MRFSSARSVLLSKLRSPSRGPSLLGAELVRVRGLGDASTSYRTGEKVVLLSVKGCDFALAGSPSKQQHRLSGRNTHLDFSSRLMSLWEPAAAVSGDWQGW